MILDVLQLSWMPYNDPGYPAMFLRHSAMKSKRPTLLHVLKHSTISRFPGCPATLTYPCCLRQPRTWASYDGHAMIRSQGSLDCPSHREFSSERDLGRSYYHSQILKRPTILLSPRADVPQRPTTFQVPAGPRASCCASSH